MQQFLPFIQHAESLCAEGLGDPGAMLTESIFSNHLVNPMLPQIHAKEGAKFSALAFRIAPPQLVSEYIRERTGGIPIIADIPSIKILTALSENTLACHSKGISTEKVIDYLRFVAQEPALWLGCLYMSFSQESYAAELGELTDSANQAEIGDVIRAFGQHFDAKNMVTIFPFALYHALSQQHGDHANTTLIDHQTIVNTFAFLNQIDAFALSGKGAKGTTEEGTKIELRCPMQGYLHELMIKHHALESIFQQIANIAELKVDQSKDSPLNTLLQIHQANSENVRTSALRVLGQLI